MKITIEIKNKFEELKQEAEDFGLEYSEFDLMVMAIKELKGNKENDKRKSN